MSCKRVDKSLAVELITSRPMVGTWKTHYDKRSKAHLIEKYITCTNLIRSVYVMYFMVGLAKRKMVFLLFLWLSSLLLPWWLSLYCELDTHTKAPTHTIYGWLASAVTDSHHPYLNSRHPMYHDYFNHRDDKNWIEEKRAWNLVMHIHSRLLLSNVYTSCWHKCLVQGQDLTF